MLLSCTVLSGQFQLFRSRKCLRDRRRREHDEKLVRIHRKLDSGARRLVSLRVHLPVRHAGTERVALRARRAGQPALGPELLG